MRGRPRRGALTLRRTRTRAWERLRADPWGESCGRRRGRRLRLGARVPAPRTGRTGSSRVRKAPMPPRGGFGAVAGSDSLGNPERRSRAHCGRAEARGATSPRSRACCSSVRPRGHPHPTTTRERGRESSSPSAVAECAPPRGADPTCARQPPSRPCPERRLCMRSAARDRQRSRSVRPPRRADGAAG